MRKEKYMHGCAIENRALYYLYGWLPMTCCIERRIEIMALGRPWGISSFLFLFGLFLFSIIDFCAFPEWNVFHFHSHEPKRKRNRKLLLFRKTIPVTKKCFLPVIFDAPIHQLPAASSSSSLFCFKLKFFERFLLVSISKRRRSSRPGGTNSKGQMHRSLLRDTSTEKQSQSLKGKKKNTISDLISFRYRVDLVCK